jgi:ATP-binding cassette subfamily B protein
LSKTTSTSNTSSATIIKWLGVFLRPYLTKVGIAMIALFVSAASWLILGQGIKTVIDQGFVANDISMLNTALAAVLGIAAVGCVATYFRFYYMIWLGERVSADIRKTLYDHMLKLGLDFYAQNRTGEVISRFTSDTTVLQSVIGTGLSMAIRSTVTFIGALILMLFTSIQLTLLVLIAVPIILLPIKLLGKKVRHYAQDSQDKVAQMSAHIDQSVHEIHTVQSYNRESADREHLFAKVEEVMVAAESRIHFRALLVICIMAISIGAIVFVAWIGANDVIRGDLSVGSFTAFIFYAVMAGGAVATISEVIGEIQKAIGASARIRELLNTQPNHSKTITAPPVIKAPSHSQTTTPIILEQVGFAYPSALSHPVLTDINLTIHSGQKVALVGPSGAGKSTLFQLLLDFYQPQQGTIQLWEQPMNNISSEWIRDQFALVPQDAVIFASSVVDNIAFGRTDASLSDVIEAAQLAQAHEFICQLPQGYDTSLGERGVKLSGGQKQRIAIARAILANRPILLLDEATSALDAASELAVKQALEALMQNKTTLIIAHRLSTVINADVIVVFENGQIISQGTHTQLLESCATYRELATIQLLD